MVKISILSILDNTNFSGDIVVLSDEKGIPSDINLRTSRVRTINILPHIPELSTKNLNKFNIFCIKPFISKVVDLKKYDFCMYVDADVLFKMPNLNEVMVFFKSIGKIQISDNDGWTVAKKQWSTGVQVLTEEEILKHKDFGVCAGIVGIPCNDLGLSFLKTWQDYNRRGDFELDDQGNLTAIMIRYFSEYYSFMPFLNKDRWNLKDITHYCSGNSKAMFWHHARHLLRKYSSKKRCKDGIYIMNKPRESLLNDWEFHNGMIYVSQPHLTGCLQSTIFCDYVWWLNGEGFEKIIDELSGDSFRNGSFSLTPKMHSSGG